MLYAFDGTWNTDKPGADRDTNVAWFHRAYSGNAMYWQGVGTRFGAIGHVLGGMSGARGRERVAEAVEVATALIDTCDDAIDVVGFSRGAALALHFCNQVAKLPSCPPIRFLGLWDCVPSFGTASIELNFGWDLDLPDNVVKCYHALALDEQRQTFQLHRLNARVEDANQEGRLFEVWFRGIHSDVGGGNTNPGLSSIALDWILHKASSLGLPLRHEVVVENQARLLPGATVSDVPWHDLVRSRARVVRWNDQVHRSVTFATGCVNPPSGVTLVDNDGAEVGRFVVGSPSDGRRVLPVGQIGIDRRRHPAAVIDRPHDE